MKKPLLILFLFFFSIQSYANSCPDGSDPVRSISEDGTYFVFSCQSNTDMNKNTRASGGNLAQNKSIFVSDKDFNDFLNLPKEERISSCGYKSFSPNWRVINKDLAPRIKGYNSKMDNWRKVEGEYSRDVLIKYLEASTHAMVSDDKALKEKLFDKLYQWASEDALSATMQCYFANGPLDLAPACEGEWSDPDGQDLAPIKDATVAVETVMSLNYLYKLYYADYKPEDDRHKVILGWFESFYPRIMTSRDFYFGNSVGWHFPNISIKHSLDRNYKTLIENMVNGLDEWSFADGSMKERTTRGNRALWYHSNALGEAFIILEIARIAEVEIPPTLEKKLLKAAELFNDAFLDHSVIEPWAKKRVRSQASNGRQEFNSNLDSISFYSSWMQLFQLRYPEHRTAQWLNQELTSKASSLKSNQVTGVPLGCISKALADNSPESKAKKEAEASDLSIYEFDGKNFDLSIDKIDFVELRPHVLEREEEYLRSYQIHKSKIKGQLVGKDGLISRFATLVFKHSGDVEQNLVINIQNPTLMAFSRHTDSLPKKCGSDVMEWGWLSFISKTNEQKSAKKQQCIYDYFNDSNDNQAKDLYVSILGATESILNYLEKNVEP
jgi:hypothetical protein